MWSHIRIQGVIDEVETIGLFWTNVYCGEYKNQRDKLPSMEIQLPWTKLMRHACMH